jgi:UDP-N-acetylmuramate: L-alanyl-gamma-D-glutamyl-meso-diaminopimelate ligase
MIIEGDEYLTSPIDRRPKFHLYQPDIALISGIAWDHINVFPTFEEYLKQFSIFIDTITENGTLVYCSEDKWVNELCHDYRKDISLLPYALPEHTISDGTTYLTGNGTSYPLMVFGHHNLLNINGARTVCAQLGIDADAFNRAIQTFRGASKRLEKIGSNTNGTVFKDFAHAPSKVDATLRAVREQFPGKKIVACLELHTYSSLNKDFLPLYKGALDHADIALVYYNQHALQIKRLPDLDPEVIATSFDNPRLEVWNESEKLKKRLQRENGNDTIYLMMSSGNYDGIDLETLINHS